MSQRGDFRMVGVACVVLRAVRLCVFVVASLVALPVVLEFENGSRDEDLLLFSMSQRGDFWMVGVACVVLRAVRLICWMPD